MTEVIWLQICRVFSERKRQSERWRGREKGEREKDRAHQCPIGENQELILGKMANIMVKTTRDKGITLNKNLMPWGKNRENLQF